MSFEGAGITVSTENDEPEYPCAMAVMFVAPARKLVWASKRVYDAPAGMNTVLATLTTVSLEDESWTRMPVIGALTGLPTESSKSSSRTV